MKLLLDTHAFIWWDNEPAKLSPRVLALCQDRTNILLLSVASVWEMQIKLQLGKLKLNLPLVEIIETQQQRNNIEVLPVALAPYVRIDVACENKWKAGREREKGSESTTNGGVSQSGSGKVSESRGAV
ncbi:MAG: type II toxin-antitoxin system VapC family toxin, partial [Deltaproteobacteria bacterium]|nr:type II toxin-antitoxin system VapC family toxin [Deltaproteobacteria bacterium]